MAVRRNSPSRARPSASSAMLLLRSPCATAPITRATSLVGWTRSAIRELTESIERRQKPLGCGIAARSLMRPSLPTAWLRRASSSDIRVFCSTTSLNTSASLPCSPVQSAGSVVPSPFLRAVNAAWIARLHSCAVPVASIRPFIRRACCSQKPLRRSVSMRALALARNAEPFAACSMASVCRWHWSASRFSSAASRPRSPCQSTGNLSVVSPRRNAATALISRASSLSAILSSATTIVSIRSLVL